MIGENWPFISGLLGLGADSLALWQMAARGVIVYLAAIVLVRVGAKRFLGKYAALDVILGFILGSILSSAVIGGAPFFETIAGAGLALVLMHWIFAALSFRYERFGDLVKGNVRVLVRDGDILWDTMKDSHISKQDLLAAMRTGARLEDVQRIQVARLERSGDISIIERERQPRIVEIQVEDDIQTVRLEID